MIKKQKTIRRIIVFLVLILVIPVLSVLAAAARTDTMTATEAANLTGANWMYGIADGRYLHEINIPGTHDSGMNVNDVSKDAYQNGAVVLKDVRDAVLTQTKSISEQLDAGVRLIEIGLTDQGDTSWSNYNDKDLYVCSSVQSNGSSYLYYSLKADKTGAKTLEDVVEELIAFLEKDTAETVLLMIRAETGDRDVIISRANHYFSSLKERMNSRTKEGILLWEGEEYLLTKMPTLDSCRGKIVLLSEIVDSNGANALNYGAACAPTTESITILERTFACEPLKEQAFADKKNRILTFLSGQTKIPGSSDAPLSSGQIMFTASRKSDSEDAEYYIASNQLNPILYRGSEDTEALLSVRGKYYGWVLSDFPGGSEQFADMIKTLWQTNFCAYYKVQFSAGSSTSSIPAQSVRSGDNAEKPSDPVLSGYSFDGWYTDKEYKNAYDFSTPVTGDLTLYAKWVKLYSVQFNLNYSPSQPVKSQVKSGGTAEKPETPVRDGYTFDGWYKEKECQNKFDFSTPVNQDLNLYAAWTCTFTFEPNGGTMSVPLQQEIRTGNRATEPSAPKKTGLTFAGWYSNSSLTLPYNFTTTVTKATTVYAKWTALVTFGSNGGTGTMNPVTVNEGQQYSLPTCYFTPPRGHKFDGWDLGPAGTKIEITGPVSLQAQWKEVGGNSASYTGNYNVTFYTNGGSSIPSQSIPYGQAVTRPADPVRQGYEFDNWYTDGTYSTVYDFQSPVTTSLTLYAKWLSSEYYTISFDANGGSGWMESIRVDRGSSYVLPGCNFTAPAGKRFVRWNFGPAGESMNVNSDMILVAQWGAVQDETPAVIYHYTVRFDTGGGSEVPEQTVESGNCAVKPENPTRRGFIFDGWYSDIARKVPYDFLEEVSSDMTLYCGWISGVLTGEISYRITNGEDQQYEKGSDRDVVIVVKRSWDDDSCYTHFTNVVLDNRVLSRYRDYTAASGSTIITFDRSFLNGTENGLHTVRIVFNDGSVETTLRIGGEDQETTTSTEPQSHEEDSPVTGDPSAQDLPMWASLLVLSGCAAICLMIVLYMKKAAAKQAEKKGEKNEF